MNVIKVPLGERSYQIVIGKGNLRLLFPFIGQSFPGISRLIILTDTTVNRLYQKTLQKILKKYHPQWIVIPSGEQHKNLQTVETVYHRLITCGADRQSVLIALGGGVVGDLAGFVAATFLRGIPFIQVPTTLLAQVDSSVGGKTGVDLVEGKNLVGAFYQPRHVVIDTSVLSTLPQREFLCGMSEVVKYGLLADEKLFGFVENNHQKILNLDPKALEHIINRSCAIKADIVGKDERELASRSLLNLGHTLGHAIETLSGYKKFHHGEAVAAGMCYASFLSSKKGFLAKNEVGRVMNLLEKLKLPTHWPAYPKRKYAQVIAVDKKANTGTIRFVMLKKIGKAFVVPLKVNEVVKYL